MKNIVSIVFVFSVLLLVSSCDDDNWSLSYPFVKTVGIENYNDTSAVIKGEIEILGSDKIVDYGYVMNYSRLRFFSHANIKNEEGQFEMYLSSVLRSGYLISIAAYAKTNDKTIVGEFITYECTENVLPEIESITPISGDVNVVRTMVVKNFCDFYGYLVLVNGSAFQVKTTFIAPDTIEIVLPSDLEPGSYVVKINNRGTAEYHEEIIVTE